MVRPGWLRIAYLCCSLLVACSGDGGEGGGRRNGQGDAGNDGGNNIGGDSTPTPGKTLRPRAANRCATRTTAVEAVFDRCDGLLKCGGCTDGKICGVQRDDTV